MFRALLWKEWRQLRTLRWTAAVLMVLASPLILALSEAASRGWLPFGTVRSYDVTSVLMDAVPWCLVATWSIFSLLMTAQTFTSDRATGTEAFLLERPVDRGTVWNARLTASLGSVLLVVAVSLVLWASYAVLVADPGPEHWDGAWKILLIVGGSALVISFVGGLAASAFLDAPMGAFLLGMVLPLVPLGLGVFLMARFPFASFFTVPVGGALMLLFLPAFPLASRIALCRGEPAGRGRRLRGAAVLCGTLLVVVVLFLILAPVSVRSGAGHDMSASTAFPSAATGRVAFQSGTYWGSRAWVVDARTGEKLRFLNPPVEDLAWSPDGAHLAVATQSGPLGSVKPQTRIEIYDSETVSRQRSTPLPEDFYIRNALWTADGLLITGSRLRKVEGKNRSEFRAAFLFLPSGGGSVRELQPDIPLSGTSYYDWGVFPSLDRQKFFLASMSEEHVKALNLTRKKRSGDQGHFRFTLYELTVDEDQLRTRVLLEQPGTANGAWRRLSGSGEYWLESGGSRSEDPDSLRLVHMPSGESIEFEDTRIEPRLGADPSVWLADDTLVWVEIRDGRDRLRSWRPGSEPDVLKEWADGSERRFHLHRSPDGSRLLVQVLMEYGEPVGENLPRRRKVTENLVYESATGSWTDLSADGPRSHPSWWSTRWAGPETLCWSDRDSLALESLREPGRLTYVVR